MTDDDLAAIYKRANGEDVGKAQPITTARVFKAMRAMLAAQLGAVQVAHIMSLVDDLTDNHASMDNWTYQKARAAVEAALRDAPQQADEFEVRADGDRVRKDRWEYGIRRIVAVLWGNRKAFEIDEVVEAVRALAPKDHEDDTNLADAILATHSVPTAVEPDEPWKILPLSAEILHLDEEMFKAVLTEIRANVSAALAALRSMPQGEPVAWVLRSGHGTHFKEGKNRPSELMHAGQYVWQPLFATPHTAPVPLSDAELQDLQGAVYADLVRKGYNGGMGSEQWDEAYGRAVERAVLGRGGEKQEGHHGNV